MEEQFVRCLMVETGQEQVVARLLAARKLGKALYPERARIRKLRGVWKKDHVRLLPGYVFVFSAEPVSVRYYQRIEHVLKVLRYDREPEGYLRGTDLDFACAVRELDGKLGILEAVDENGFIRVTDSLLETLGGEVLSVDRGKRQARIRVTLMGQDKTILMNYQLMGDDGRPLDPVEELLEDETDEWFTAWTPDFAEELVEEMDRAGPGGVRDGYGGDPDAGIGTEGNRDGDSTRKGEEGT